MPLQNTLEMTTIHIDNLRRAESARDYWNVDGIPTLLGAALYLGTVGFLLVLLLIWKRFFEFFGKPPTAVLLLTALLLMIALRMWVSMNWGEMIEWFKVRITYPRTGYVTPPGYWHDESTRPAALQHKAWFRKVLSVLSGFWFWCVLTTLLEIRLGYQGAMQARRILMLLLGILVVIRGVRFGIYREGPVPGDRHKPGILMQAVRFSWYVLNGFWVWIFLLTLLFQQLQPHRPASGNLCLLVCLLWAGFLLGQSFSLFPILLPNWARFQAVSLCLCGTVCAFLVSRTPLIGTVVTLFIPGLWAAYAGGLRLYRYLRDNPIRSI